MPLSDFSDDCQLSLISLVVWSTELQSSSDVVSHGIDLKF